MRTLSTTTTESAQQAESFLNGLADTSNQLGDINRTLSANVDEIAASTVETLSELGQQLNRISETQTDLDDANWRSKLELAIIDETFLRSDVIAFVHHGSGAPAPTVPGADECGIGQWYYDTEIQSRFRHNTFFRNLEPPHAQVHAFAEKAIEYALAQQLDTAQQQLDRMEEQYQIVEKGLLALIREGA